MGCSSARSKKQLLLLGTRQVNFRAMKRLSPAEQLAVLDAVVVTIGRLRDHAAIHNDASAARRLDEEHTAVDESKQKMLWTLDAEQQEAYRALTKALAASKKPAAKKPATQKTSAKKAKRLPRASKAAGKRVR